jgi:hypothetical protein
MGSLVGALLFGVAGFLSGFFGPLMFTPEANQGPLLGICFTGPFGLVIGAIVGGAAGAMTRRVALTIALVIACAVGYGAIVFVGCGL